MKSYILSPFFLSLIGLVGSGKSKNELHEGDSVENGYSSDFLSGKTKVGSGVVSCCCHL